MSSQNNPSAASASGGFTNISSAEAASSSSYPRTVPSTQRQASKMSQMSGHESVGPYSESAQSAGTVRRISDAGDGARDVPSMCIFHLYFSTQTSKPIFDF